jgi:hypothetical protein
MCAAANESDRMDLEPAPPAYVAPPADRRKQIPEPPPVRLTAIEDVVVETVAGLENALDEFYVTMLQFERDPTARAGPVYRAENLRLVFEVHELPIERPDLRPVGVEVLSLVDLEQKIVTRELEYQRVKGLTAGSDQLLLQDPAGNWISITERRGVR